MMVVRFMASITSSTAPLGTPTVAKSVMLIGPIYARSGASRWLWLDRSWAAAVGR
jgi:hypothetical protein